MIEKLFQIFEHEILGFGVLIGELEHHSPDGDLAAGVCFSFAGGDEGFCNCRHEKTGSLLLLPSAPAIPPQKLIG